ncbi:MAG: hypothetical protein WCK33_01050 [Phycisphaerae bacterium]|jgi:hypothetical protein
MNSGPLSNRSVRLRLRLVAGLVAGVFVAAGGPLGCMQQYSNYPEIPSAKGLKQDPNTPASESAMVAALQFVANRYTPGTMRLDAKNAREAGEMTTSTPMVVNLPVGQRQSYYRRIARRVGPNVAPMTGDVDASLPVYHVTRVWLRFSEGWVDVMRPMPELPPGPDGKPVYQTVTLKMTGGFGPWRVLHARAWPPGIDPIPEPYVLPDEERIDQYELSSRAKGDYREQFRAWEANAKAPSEPPAAKEP